MFLPLFESGDEILEVNSQNIRGYTHNEAIRIFKVLLCALYFLFFMFCGNYFSNLSFYQLLVCFLHLS